jgi:hypothetical protein
MGRTAHLAAAPTDTRSTLRHVLPPLENRDPGDETAEDEA